MDPKRNKQLRQKRDKLDRKLAKGHAETTSHDLTSAIEAFNRGDIATCLSQCDWIIESHPSQIAAYMLKGRAYLAHGNSHEAVRVVKSALDSGLDDASLWCELGNLYSENGELESAVSAWKSSLSLDSNIYIARKNLGLAFFELNQLPDAESNLVIALQHDPFDLPTMRTLAILWNKQSKFQQATDLLEKALSHHSPDGVTYKLLSSIYRGAGELEKYKSTLKRWLKAEPENAIAKHLVSGALEDAGTAPERASDQYIREVFDQFAATFDSDLEHLHYEAPAHIARALERVYSKCETQPSRAILDAGCGTGICGSLLRPYAQSLVGVDLSSQMVKVADQRGCYDKLEVTELTAYLQQHANTFNAIVGCDTFNYFGDLSELLDACRSALKDQGLLVITLEHEHKSDCEDYKLNMNGRYTHSRSYVEQTATLSDLRIVDVEQVLLRTEADRPVEGLLITLQK